MAWVEIAGGIHIDADSPVNDSMMLHVGEEGNKEEKITKTGTTLIKHVKLATGETLTTFTTVKEEEREMSAPYAQFGDDSDVFIDAVADTKSVVQCTDCTLKYGSYQNRMEDVEMSNHLIAHKARGDKVPEQTMRYFRAILRL